MMARQISRAPNASNHRSCMEADDILEDIATVNITEYGTIQKTSAAPKGTMLCASKRNFTAVSPKLNDDNDTSRKSSRLLLKSAHNRTFIEYPDKKDYDLCLPDNLRMKIKSKFSKNLIQVGSLFQPVIPEKLCKYITSHENEGVLLWNPSKLSEEKVEEYLTDSQILKYGRCPQRSSVKHRVKDNEQDLKILQKCGYDTEVALQLIQMKICPENSCMTAWTQEECKRFEDGIKEYGKNFYKIHKKVNTRSVKEVVQFYYLWKKTERHDTFVAANRNGKKNKLVKPECTDYMGRFMDEQEYPYTDRNSSSHRIQVPEGKNAPPLITSQPNSYSLDLEFRKLKITDKHP